MNVTKYERNGLELWVDEATGRAYADVESIARMFGMDPNDPTLRRHLERVHTDKIKTAEIPTSQGVRMTQLYPSSVVFTLALKQSRT